MLANILICLFLYNILAISLSIYNSFIYEAYEVLCINAAPMNKLISDFQTDIYGLCLNNNWYK